MAATGTHAAAVLCEINHRRAATECYSPVLALVAAAGGGAELDVGGTGLGAQVLACDVVPGRGGGKGGEG